MAVELASADPFYQYCMECGSHHSIAGMAIEPGAYRYECSVSGALPVAAGRRQEFSLKGFLQLSPPIVGIFLQCIIFSRLCN